MTQEAATVLESSVAEWMLGSGNDAKITISVVSPSGTTQVGSIEAAAGDYRLVRDTGE